MHHTAKLIKNERTPVPVQFAPIAIPAIIGYYQANLAAIIAPSIEANPLLLKNSFTPRLQPDDYRENQPHQG
jgi:hypothetical protein